MSSKANLLALVREHQNKRPDTDIYFSLSTCVQYIMGKEPTDIFILSFGRKTSFPEGIIHKHIPIEASEFVSFQPFKLDTLLISANDGRVIDVFGAVENINHKRIETVKDPDMVLDDKPFLGIRAAAIMAETGFTLSEELEAAVIKYARRLRYVDGKILWREFKRVLRAEKPSVGIEFLRKTGILGIILPELDACYGVEQNNRYHKYTVYEHCLMACDACVREDVRVRFAALIHDIGKPSTRGTNDKGITFHKHEVVSTKMTKRIVLRFGLGKKDANFIVLLVSNHMYQYDRVWKDATMRKFIRKVGLNKSYLGRISEFPLFQLRHADRMGRGLSPNTQKQHDFEERIEAVLKEM